jgi:hypothetical protein
MGRHTIRVLAAACGLVATLGFASLVGAQGQSVQLHLDSQNNSGITGTATLTDEGGGKLKVVVQTQGAGAVTRPAHIHAGTCASLQGGPVFSLQPVTNDASTTEVNGSLATLLASPHAIHMHKSADELTTYVACADIKMADQAQPSGLPASGMAGSPLGLEAGLAGLGLAAAGYMMRRSRQ